MDRRNFLIVTGAALTSSAHEWLIARSVPTVTRIGGRVVTPEVVDHLEDITAQLRRMDDKMGGGARITLSAPTSGTSQMSCGSAATVILLAAGCTEVLPNSCASAGGFPLTVACTPTRNVSS